MSYTCHGTAYIDIARVVVGVALLVTAGVVGGVERMCRTGDREDVAHCSARVGQVLQRIVRASRQRHLQIYQPEPLFVITAHRHAAMTIVPPRTVPPMPFVAVLSGLRAFVFLFASWRPWREHLPSFCQIASIRHQQNNMLQSALGVCVWARQCPRSSGV